jgi:hypothetical protein
VPSMPSMPSSSGTVGSAIFRGTQISACKHTAHTTSQDQRMSRRRRRRRRCRDITTTTTRSWSILPLFAAVNGSGSLSYSQDLYYFAEKGPECVGCVAKNQ